MLWHHRLDPKRRQLVRRRGYSLLELAAVMTLSLVIAGIGVVGFNAVNARQQRSAARSDISAVMQAQTRFLSVYDTFTDLPSDLSGVPRQIAVQTNPATSHHQVAIALAQSGALGLASVSADGTCAFMFVPAVGGPGSLTEWEGDAGDLCDARSAIPAGDYALDPGPSRTSAVLSQP
jgi:prepilin-type N-terminal cleavage/methylation domain-containing protein